ERSRCGADHRRGLRGAGRAPGPAHRAGAADRRGAAVPLPADPGRGGGCAVFDAAGDQRAGVRRHVRDRRRPDPRIGIARAL
ncbi:MAG: hypothetical protein AVDCRST_MAG09-2090, partial [uncultured Sphingomonas sp.]